MYTKRVVATTLMILAIMTAVSLITASIGGLVISAFAVKKVEARAIQVVVRQLVKKVRLVLVVAQVQRASLSNVLQQYQEVLQRLM